MKQKHYTYSSIYCGLSFTVIFHWNRLHVPAATVFCSVLCTASHPTGSASEAERLVVILNFPLSSFLPVLFLLPTLLCYSLQKLTVKSWWTTWIKDLCLCFINEFILIIISYLSIFHLQCMLAGGNQCFLLLERLMRKELPDWWI